jgi:hypothetical protein
MSVLEEAPGYSVVNGLPHDLLHDLFTVPYEMKLLLLYTLSSYPRSISQLFKT